MSSGCDEAKICTRRSCNISSSACISAWVKMLARSLCVLLLFVHAARATCVGDCGVDRQVTVDELLTMVNVALGNASVSICLAGDANRDGQITIDEILTAVNGALSGC